MASDHQAKVQRVAAEVQKFYELKRPFYIFHGSTNATRHLQFNKSTTIDTSEFNEVLEVNYSKRTMRVEPNVPMDTLLRAALKHGLLPPVVMEFPGITVGGGIQGMAGESSSFKWGGFHQTCNSVDMILGSGKTITASRTQNSDLFFGAAGSFGSLGVITSAELQLIPAMQYVQLTYLPVDGFQPAVDLLKQVVANGRYDYIDGIMFSSTSGVVMVGRLSDKKVGKLARFTRAYDDWFYLHAQKISERAAEYTETIPITDYLFRYDRGGFWVGRFPFERAGWPFNQFTRWYANPMLKTRKLYEALHASGAAEQYIVQDLALPNSKAATFMEFIDKIFDTYPLWLCPLKLEDEASPLLCNSLKTTGPVINVGVWDNHPFHDYDEFVAANRKLETKLKALGGQKWFYAHSYYTEDEFWNIYDRTWYNRLRKKYDAETLPNVYEKIRTKGRKSVNIKKASFQALFGLARLKIKD